MALPTLALAVAVMLLWIAPSGADPSPPDLTTVAVIPDGNGHCLDESGEETCNVFDGSAYAWVGGEPLSGALPDGNYFFAVLSPDETPNPNDGSGSENLSDNFDTYTQREFSVVDGTVSEYSGDHDSVGGVGKEQSSGLLKIRLSPYLPTASQAGVYQLAVCLLGQLGKPKNYPVSIDDCFFDNFKIPDRDQDAPECLPLEFGLDSDGHHWVRQRFADGGGVDSLTVSNVKNATWNVEHFYRGSPGPVTMTATKLNQALTARIHIWVRDVAGHQSECDPILATMHRTAKSTGAQSFTRLAQDDSRIAIKNGRPGYRTLRIVVNGHGLVGLRLRPGQTRRVDARRLMRSGKHNSIVVYGRGAPGASADVVIGN